MNYSVDWDGPGEREQTHVTCSVAETRDRLAAKDRRIGELTEAVWEYGQHRHNCRIKDGACCDCGFFEVIASLKE